MVTQNSFGNILRDPLIQQGGDALGDMYYRDSNGRLKRLAVGTTGQVLFVGAGNIPGWTSGVSPSGNAGGVLSGTYPNPGILDNIVDFTKLQDIPTQTILGRSSAGNGDPSALTATQVRTILGLGSSALVNTGNAVGNTPLVEASGKLNSAIIPIIPSGNPPQVVASQAAMLALSGLVINDRVVVINSGNTSENASWVLAALPSSNIANWVKTSDNSIDGAEIVSGTISGDRLGGGSTVPGAVLSRSGWIVPSSTKMPTTVLTANGSLAVNSAHLFDSVSKVTGTLPTTAAVGDVIRLMGTNSGGFLIAQNTGQSIRFLNLTTSTGATGKLETLTAEPYVTLDLICTVANTVFQVFSASGNIDVV
jgi:hypothetical protein